MAGKAARDIGGNKAMATAAIKEEHISVKPELKTMTELINEIIEARKAEAIRKDITGKVRFAVEQSDGRCMHIDDITFRTAISLTDGCTGTCEVVQDKQTVFRASYDKYNKDIEQVHMYIPGDWESTLEKLVDESQRLQNDKAEQLLYTTANAWHIKIGDSI
ncbi:MAG: hypothetical protein ACYC0V_00250 [Armatimonadota bacterium]